MSFGNSHYRDAINEAIKIAADESATEHERTLAIAVKAITDAMASYAINEETKQFRDSQES